MKAREGASGLLVTPRDPEALANAMSRIARRPEVRGPMGRAGRKHVEENFDVNTPNGRFVELYQQVAGQFRVIGRRAVDACR